jgi:hypothetical protein
MNYDEWLKLGQASGWVGPAVCATHDDIPRSEAEDDEFEDGDPCIHILRLYPDLETKAAVEANHGPTIWRDAA